MKKPTFNWGLTIIFLTIVALALMNPDDPRYLKLINLIAWLNIIVLSGFALSILIAHWQQKRGSKKAQDYLSLLRHNRLSEKISPWVHLRTKMLVAGTILAGATSSGFVLLGAVILFLCVRYFYLPSQH